MQRLLASGANPLRLVLGHQPLDARGGGRCRPRAPMVPEPRPRRTESSHDQGRLGQLGQLHQRRGSRRLPAKQQPRHGAHGPGTSLRRRAPRIRRPERDSGGQRRFARRERNGTRPRPAPARFPLLDRRPRIHNWCTLHQQPRPDSHRWRSNLPRQCLCRSFLPDRGHF